MLTTLAGLLMAALLAGRAATPAELQPENVESLLEDLRSPKRTTREAAAAALGDLVRVRRDVLEGLGEALADTDDGVRTATRRALERLSATDGFSEAAAGLNRPPRPIKITRPQYPQAAFIDKVEGTVLVEILIGRDGAVIEARVITSVPGLDDAAVATARTWVFAPAIRDGRTVQTIAHAPVKFWIE